MIDSVRLKSVLRYDPCEGQFYWVQRMGSRAAAGSKTGTINKHGYIVIRVDNKLYYAHRLAWLYHYEENANIVDHIDGNRSNNKIANLRSVTQSLNLANTRLRNRNKCGLKGVSQHRVTGKWCAEISYEGKRHRLGHFDCPAAASFAYQIAADKLFGAHARVF